MPKVRAGGSNKWVNRASIATPEYESGITNPRRDWSEATAGANESWKAGIQQAIARDGFSKGVKKAGSGKWRDKALKVGASRFVQGVQEGQNAYETGIAPFLDVISKTVLPPRGPKGDPRNLDRVRIMADALRKAKTNK